MFQRFFSSLYPGLVSGELTLPQKLFLFGCGVILSLAAAFLCQCVIRKCFFRYYPKMERARTRVTGAVKYPVFWCLALTGIRGSLAIFSFPAEIANRIGQVYFTVTVLLILWGLLRLVNVCCSAFLSDSPKADSVYDELLISLLAPAAKTVIWVIGILFILDNVFQFKIGTLLAGAGIASMAVAFAAQNTIANLFGAIALIVDRPFLVGQFIRLDGKDGVVRSIGLRSIRLKAADGTVWCIPNKTVAEASIVNLSERAFFAHTIVLSLTYSHTPEQMQKGKDLLREILSSHPLVDTEAYPLRISFDNLGASSLDLCAVCRIRTSSAAEFVKAKDEINMKILQTFNENGLDFAFPTQSIHIESMPSGIQK